MINPIPDLPEDYEIRGYYIESEEEPEFDKEREIEIELED